MGRPILFSLEHSLHLFKPITLLDLLLFLFFPLDLSPTLPPWSLSTSAHTHAPEGDVSSHILGFSMLIPPTHRSRPRDNWMVPPDQTQGLHTNPFLSSCSTGKVYPIANCKNRTSSQTKSIFLFFWTLVWDKLCVTMCIPHSKPFFSKAKTEPQPPKKKLKHKANSISTSWTWILKWPIPVTVNFFKWIVIAAFFYHSERNITNSHT